MGTFKKNGDWWIDYYDECRQRHRIKIGPSKTLAENALRKRKLDIAEGKFLDKKKLERIEFTIFAADFVNLYCNQNHKTPEKTADTHVRKLKEYFGGKYLDEITPMSLEQFKADRAKEVSPATVNRALSFMRCLFNRAIDWGKFHGENPVRKVKFFKENNSRLRYLEKEEIERLLSNCKDQLKVIVTVAIHTGMRRGEIFGLKWQDIDFQRNIIYLLDTKNGDKREVPMNETVKNALISVRKHPASPYIFYRRDGSRILTVRKVFATALNKSGIEQFRFHDLRHTFCSQLAMSGIDINTVRELAGHKTLQMTLRYSHLSPSHKYRAVEILSQRLESINLPKTEANIFLHEMGIK